jgi:hypothetical protein
MGTHSSKEGFNRHLDTYNYNYPKPDLNNEFLAYQQLQFQSPHHNRNFNGFNLLEKQNLSSVNYSSHIINKNLVANNSGLNYLNKNQVLNTNYNNNNNIINNKNNSHSNNINNNSINNNNGDVKEEVTKTAHNNIILRKSPRLTKSTLLHELLECPICMNTFDNPHVLPCQHTFCKNCILSLKKNELNPSDQLNCPICRESHILLKGLDSLTANYTMKRLIELESMNTEKEKVVNEKPKETAKCIVCQNYLCLRVCQDCSYMRCEECIANPDHQIIIGYLN